MSTQPPPTVIVNPAAGGGRVRRHWDQLETRLRDHLGALTIVQTQHHGHAWTLAQQAVHDGARRVFSLGGDGTHNEVLNGILAASGPSGEIELGILHAGTGGDFRRLLLGGGELNVTLPAMREASSTPIDVISVEYRGQTGDTEQRYCLNMTAAGLSGTVVRRVNRSSKRFGGRVTFFMATIRSLLDFHPPMVHLVLDDEMIGQFRVQNVIAANGKWAGGGMKLAPDARLADKQMDIVILRTAPLLQTLLLSRAVYNGTHVHSELVDVHQGAILRVTSRSRNPVHLDIDGESPGSLPATFTLVPGAVRLLAADPAML